jgi:archaellum biogenesis ATPase FlaH
MEQVKMSDIQHVILSNLIHNNDFCRTALPYIETEYFTEAEGRVFDLIDNYFEEYNRLPSAKILEIDLLNADMSDTRAQESFEVIKSISVPENFAVDNDWLVKNAEEWCQSRAVENAVMKSIRVLDGKEADTTKEMIPDFLRNALSVCFDSSVGHDYILDAVERHEYYNLEVAKIPSDLEMINRITKGGYVRKTLTVILAGTGVGKSMFMCHSAASALKMGHDVLYITAEMAEIKIAERIDANLFNVPLNDIENMSRDMFISKVDKIKAKTQGRLVIKEYPTGSCHVGHFRHLLNELKHKQNMKPDVIFVDYLNICASARMKNNGNVNSYTLVKSIAEELRGLAIEFDVPVITATQTNREGYGNSDVDLTNVSESFGLPATADLMFALIATDELKRMNQVVVKQLKNRYSDPGDMPKFNLGVDRAKMKFFDCDQPTAGLSSEPRGKASDNIDVFVPGKAPASDFGSFNF